MSPDLILVVALLVFLVAAAFEVPVGIALVLGGTVGVVLMEGTFVAEDVLGAVPYSSSASYSLFAIPMFVFLGALIANSGISGHIFAASATLLRRIPGGIGATAVVATTAMSGISGSSAADVATMGRICVSEMRKVGYPPARAAAIVAAAGAFAALIPPAIGLVVYAVVAGESVGKMLLAGIVPGLLSAFALIVFLVYRAVREGQTAPASSALVGVGGGGGGGVATLEPDEESELGDRRQRVVGVLMAGVLFVVVMGGIYTGWVTATEAGAVGAFVAVLLTALARRSRPMPLIPTLTKSISETVHTTAMIFLLLLGGTLVAYLMVITNLPARLSEWVIGLPVPPLVVVAGFLVVLLPLGMFLDGLSIMLLTIPIVAPVIDSLGYDGIWFGILFMKMMEIGLITPPVGINCYIVSGIVEDVEVESVFRQVLPFVALDLCVTAFLFAVPAVTLWLPNLAG